MIVPKAAWRTNTTTETPATLPTKRPSKKPLIKNRLVPKKGDAKNKRVRTGDAFGDLRHTSSNKSVIKIAPSTLFPPIIKEEIESTGEDSRRSENDKDEEFQIEEKQIKEDRSAMNA